MVNMTEGNISKHLLKYSIPLILGNLFQLTYNAVDSIIAGRFAGKDSLAAIGTANPVMSIVILGVSGICLGASVLMSEFFGAGDEAQLKKEVATTIVAGGIFSLAVALLGLFLSRPLLVLMSVPNEILDLATLYLKVILLGFPFTYLYNAVSAAMRSIGDSRTPIYFLALSSVINASLDMLFIAGFHWNVVGAGLATDLAEGISALLCVYYVYRKIPILSLKPKQLRIDRPLLKKTLDYGAFTALQQSSLQIGKLLIQGVVNPLGVDVIAAFNAVNRVDDFAFTPEQSIAGGMTTFIAQNRGAKKTERIQKGFHSGMFWEVIYWLLIGSVILFLKEPIMNLFVTGSDHKIITLGTNYLHMMAFFYLLPAMTNGLQGYFRGMGNMKITFLSTLTQMIFRVLFSYLLVPSMGMEGIAFACLLGWVAMLLVEVPYYAVYQKHKEDFVQ